MGIFRRPIWIALGLALLLLPIGTFAQASSSLSAQQTDPTVTQVLRSSLLATAGSIAIQDVTISAQAERIAGSQDETGTARLRATTAASSRIDYSFPSGNTVESQSSDASGKRGAWLDPSGTSHIMPGHNLMTGGAWFCPVLTLTELLLDPTYTASYLGLESRNGHSVLHFAVIQTPSGAAGVSLTQFQRLSRMELYLDSSSLLPVALAFNTHPDTDAATDIQVEIRFSDYRPAKGVQTPFHVQRFVNGGLALDLQIQSVSFNSGLTAAELTL